jgi:3-hydroxyisobutyrate dehydrogenase-like beta-hydroxyacid dehydrogenase
MANLGFIGLGVMGSRMVKRLLDAGHNVAIYNRTKAKGDWLVEAGAHWADTPRQVVESSDFSFSMVTNTKALDAITQGPDGVLAGLAAGKIYVDMSTVSPEKSQQVAAQVAETGAVMLDAPVSGSVETLEAGLLSVMVGGDEAAFAKVRPYLTDIAPKAQHHVGGNGLAVAMKIASNLSLAVQMLAFSEGILLAEKMGIKREVAADVLFNSVIASPMIKYRGPFVLDMPDEAWFNVNMMQKDMNLALELAQHLDIPMPTTSVTNEYLTAARGMMSGVS